MSSAKSHHSRKIEINRKRYEVYKYQYWEMDCIDLFIELLILLNCQFICACRPCTNLLKYVVETEINGTILHLLISNNL